MQPRVTEVRDGAGRVVTPGVQIGQPMPLGSPVPFGGPPAGAVVVPSVGPNGGVPGIACEDPLYAGGPVGTAGPGVAALSRLPGGTGRWWVTGEYLMWWTRSTQLPPLVTTSSPQFNGILGTGDTRTLLGGSFGDNFHSGARFGGGFWFDPCDHLRGLDARFFFLGENSQTFTADTSRFPLLARPFTNVNAPPGQFAQIVGAPLLAAGAIEVTLKNSLSGAEVNYRRNLGGSECARLDALVGYRHVNFTEELRIAETFARVGGSDFGIGVPAARGVVVDSFRAENNFHGGQIGLAGEKRRGRWSLDGRATVAFGNVEQRGEINGGQQLVFPNGGVAQTAGGLLALPGANIGTFTQNKFAVVPEASLNLGYHLTSHLKVFVGYNFLYMSSVLRPAGMIDTGLDSARIPNFRNPADPPQFPVAGIPRPAPVMRTTDFFAQGINFGIQFTW
jgi:hypothetical protein